MICSVSGRVTSLHGQVGWWDVFRGRKPAEPGRKRDLPLFIPRGAYGLQESWLETGHALWTLVGAQDRDFFLHGRSEG